MENSKIVTIKDIATAITIIAGVPAPTHIIITGPKATFGKLFKTTKYGSATFARNFDHQSIIAIPTDSTYIYILSNYGVIGLAGTVAMLCYFVKVSRRSITGVHFLLLYVLVISMFFNCYFGDFPSNFIILSLFGFEYRLRKIGNAC